MMEDLASTYVSADCEIESQSPHSSSTSSTISPLLLTSSSTIDCWEHNDSHDFTDLNRLDEQNSTLPLSDAFLESLNYGGMFDNTALPYSSSSYTEHFSNAGDEFDHCGQLLICCLTCARSTTIQCDPGILCDTPFATTSSSGFRSLITTCRFCVQLSAHNAARSVHSSRSLSEASLIVPTILSPRKVIGKLVQEYEGLDRMSRLPIDVQDAIRERQRLLPYLDIELMDLHEHFDDIDDLDPR